jgi:hypothetical protein
VQSDSNPRECYEDERDTDNTDDITDDAVFETFEILDHKLDLLSGSEGNDAFVMRVFGTVESVAMANT